MSAPPIHPGFPPGHPLHNHTQDPHLIDESGRPIAYKKPWSQVSTDIYLNVLVAQAPVRLDRRWTGRNIRIGEDWLHISSSRGVPTADIATYGACLELPSDLGDDALKQTYVTDWFIATVNEAMYLAGHDHQKKVNFQEMIYAVEDAIRGQKL